MKTFISEWEMFNMKYQFAVYISNLVHGENVLKFNLSGLQLIFKDRCTRDKNIFKHTTCYMTYRGQFQPVCPGEHT